MLINVSNLLSFINFLPFRCEWLCFHTFQKMIVKFFIDVKMKVGG